MSTFTNDDARALLAVSGSRGWDAAHATMRAQTSADCGPIQVAEDMLTLTVIAELIRARVDRAARGIPELSTFIEEARQRVRDAERIGYEASKRAKEAARG